MALPQGFRLQPLVPRDSSDEELAAVHEVLRVLREEARPDEPQPARERTISQLRRKPPGHENHYWLIRGERDLAAYGEASMSTDGTNAHLMRFWLGVLPQFRRLGLARELLREVSAAAQRAERRLLITSSSSQAESGTRFMERIGSRIANQHTMSRLYLRDLNRQWLKSHIDHGESLKSQVRLDQLRGPWPDETLQAACAMYEIMNTEPHGEMELEDEPVTPAKLREQEAFQQANGIERWTLYARRLSEGRMVAFTELFWRPESPQVVEQGGTAVAPEFRGRGLASWLKAAMIENVLRDRPKVTEIQTGNAASNAPMLAINRQMGFKPYRTSFAWQIERRAVEAYLRGS